MAPEEADPGLERERRLQRCRVAFAEPSVREVMRRGARVPEWSEELVGEFVWLDDLARTGHWGAVRLRDRIRDSERFAKGVALLAPHAQERLAARMPRAAEARAIAECHSETPDIAAMLGWLEAADRGPLADEVREAWPIAGTLTAVDLREIAGIVRSFTAGRTMHRLARLRLQGAEAAPSDVAVRLLHAAVEKGYVPALLDLLAHAVERARAGRAPDWDVVLHGLERVGREHLALEAREARRLAGDLDARDLERIESAIGVAAAPGDFLAVLAGDRYRAGGSANVDIANAMLDRAAAFGSPKARAVLWSRDRPHATDLRSFIEDFARSGPPPESAREDCLRIALAMDRGEDPRPATSEQIARFYSWGGGPMLARDRPLTGAHCYQLAQRLDPGRGSGGIRDAALTRRWYERGIDLGDDQCLDAWLIACVCGQLGMASDPSAALAQFEHWKACGGNLEKSGWRLMSAARMMLGTARGLLKADSRDPRAAAWLRLAAALGLPEAAEVQPAS